MADGREKGRKGEEKEGRRGRWKEEEDELKIEKRI